MEEQQQIEFRPIGKMSTPMFCCDPWHPGCTKAAEVAVIAAGRRVMIWCTSCLERRYRTARGFNLAFVAAMPGVNDPWYTKEDDRRMRAESQAWLTKHKGSK